jgi:putative peptide zinc metalloprotease protein
VAEVETDDRPVLAPDVELVGEFQGTGFVEPQWLIRRGERFVQVTELLYRIAELADGRRTPDEIAEAVTDSTDWLVTPDNVRTLLASRLIPLGVIADDRSSADEAPAPERPRDTPSPLALSMRVKAIGPRAIEPVTRVLQYLFVPPIAVVTLVAAVAAHIWVYRVRGLTAAFIDALYTPSSLLIILLVILAAAVFHEFGHASALRYGGGRARAMGVGVYTVFPAFFTDVTESYRLGRWARVRTGLGGPYFHFLFALALIGVAVAFGYEFLLVAVLLINVEIARQFIPFVRLDGYWVLADLTGVPDFFSQIGPFLRSVLPRFAPTGPRLPPLKRWVKIAFGVYLAVTIPLLVALVVLLVRFLPRVMTVLWDAIATQFEFLRDALSARDAVAAATAGLELLILAVPVLGLAYLLYTLTWKPLRAAFRQPTPARQAIGLAGILAILLVVGFVWAPQLPIARGAAPAGVESFDVANNGHTRGAVAYPQSPPVGGPHSPVWQNCGFYSTPIANENGVHSLEHGAVWITYRPSLSRAQRDVLRRIARDSKYVLVTPYRGLPTAVVASSWGRQLRVASPADARLDRFVRAFRLDSRLPEAGGLCTGGKGNPE